ncbi:DNA polymerase III subunit epsilon [Corynebacterium kutscheri]|uniref:DNA polymerase III epsilon subunit-like 3'-5' exonuclease n=2 Tax=Corynebacterium kutscheri TaxID=35755 RepID=A0A0F6QZZ5_9CORY|nr:DNA polymerase III epsilon subunit-like 3'-5' exonuclease [Corynebacterium kutscheri]VEH06886.1 DNA polymerase III subunit epsilon [Corynebacterium kutscheri]VEH09298.1 DNA polymerase III subunit epsilon [Corynebacterium kutscheri]VEH79386.1 DNA polymerase III subunit epsilon [Corynebacterium kutscheri]
MKVLSFDLETTGVDPQQSKIVTSALVRIDDTGAHPSELLADPGIEIPVEATKVHGISTDYARQYGRPHDEVLAQTITEINSAWEKGYTLIVFNAAYDLSVLRALDPSFVVSGPVYDPYVIDRGFDRYRKGKRTLTSLSEHYGVKLENAHEATSDALAAARIAWIQAKRTFKKELSELDMTALMEKQAVFYYEMQSSLKSYLAGRGEDTSSINMAWPMQA